MMAAVEESPFSLGNVSPEAVHGTLAGTAENGLGGELKRKHIKLEVTVLVGRDLIIGLKRVDLIKHFMDV